jgi:hypothetical protein
MDTLTERADPDRPVVVIQPDQLAAGVEPVLPGLCACGAQLQPHDPLPNICPIEPEPPADPATPEPDPVSAAAEKIAIATAGDPAVVEQQLVSILAAEVVALDLHAECEGFATRAPEDPLNRLEADEKVLAMRTDDEGRLLAFVTSFGRKVALGPDGTYAVVIGPDFPAQPEESKETESADA